MTVTMTTQSGHVIEGDLIPTEGGFTIHGHLTCGPHDDNGLHLPGSPFFGKDAQARPNAGRRIDD